MYEIGTTRWTPEKNALVLECATKIGVKKNQPRKTLRVICDKPVAIMDIQLSGEEKELFNELVEKFFPNMK